MSRNKELYRKNSEGKWERIGPPIDTFIFSGNPSDDTEVIVTNPLYTKEGEEIKLFDALTQINNRLDKHDGNISYLAEHGGGGGGGGGSTGVYKIELVSITLNNGVYYTTTPNVTISFRIVGGTSSNRFQYRVLFGGSYINGSDYKVVGNKETINVNIEDINIYPSNTFMVDAIDPYGMDIESLSFEIREMGISITGNTKEILNIKEKGNINIGVRNKMIGTETSIILQNTTITSEPYTYTYTSTNGNLSNIPIKVIGNVIDASLVQTGKEYNVKVYAETVFGGTRFTSNEINIMVSFVGGDEIVAVYNGITSKEEYDRGNKTVFATGESMIFSFLLFYGDGKSSKNTPLYYAVQLDNTENEDFKSEYPNGILLMGKYFNDELRLSEEYTSGIQNDFVVNGNGNGITWPIPDKLMYNGGIDSETGKYRGTTGWTITVRGWINSATKFDTVSKCDFIKGNSERFEVQIPSRVEQSIVTSDTLFARWGSKNFPTSNTEKVWNSLTEKYTYITDDREDIPKVPMYVYKTNGVVSGFFNNDLPYLRFQNAAYAVIDFEDYADEIHSLNSLSNEGFDISVTFKTDVHPFNDRTVFFMGKKNVDGELMYGIEITLEKVVWKIVDGDATHILECEIRQGVLNTVDFVFNVNDSGYSNAKILINGVINASSNLNEFTQELETKAYIGCTCLNNGTLDNFADLELYDIKIFSKVLNDLQVSVNAKDSKLGNMAWTEEVKENYDSWKRRNFIYTASETSKEPLSKLFENGKYVSPNFTTLTGSTPPIPILLLEAPAESEFTKDFFYSPKEDTTITSTTFSNFSMEYYDPNLGSVKTNEVAVSLQGTSTLTYKDKNLEIYFQKKKEGSETETEMFQPKADWLPENRFTLKADVVDSAHANNTSIGKWINDVASTEILEDNPAMEALRNNYPKDIYTDANGEKVQAQRYDEEKQEYVKIVHDNVKVRHTLEGFPVLLLVKFAKELNATLLGIYSFNLGRYSYYNMGFRFLESFTRRTSGTSYEDKGCPAIIKEYQVKTGDIAIDLSRSIKQNEIYSYEFDSAGDDNTEEHCSWSQDSINVIKRMGTFRYPENVGDTEWNNIKPLFSVTANFLGKDKYDFRDGVWLPIGGKYIFDKDSNPEELCRRLNITNALAYFDIAVAFGMVDSLGKNMTLRTWDGGKTWWCCFYDMDTALKLTNAGYEEVDPMVYIDIFKNKALYIWGPGPDESSEDYRKIPFDETGSRVPYTETLPTTGINECVVYENLRPDEGKGFGSFNSGLWNILRGQYFTQYDPRGAKIYYPQVWDTLRRGALSTHNNFVELIESIVGNCGEIIYNFDYNEKYISHYEYKDKTGTTRTIYGNIEMLHGTRIETIREWLRQRFTFLDGVWHVDNGSNLLSYYRQGTMYYEGSGTEDEFHFRTSAPIMLRTNVGQSGNKHTYILKPYADNAILMESIQSSTGKATDINATDVITDISGFVGSRFQHFGANITLPSMSSFDIHGTQTLSTDPIDFDKVFGKEKAGTTVRTSDIRDINLSNTKCSGTYTIDLRNFDKLTNLNISNSNITSLSLPSAPLSTLNFNNSNIELITIERQPNISSLVFNGCKKLHTIRISDCAELTSINANGMPNLVSLTINNCPKVTSIDCSNDAALTGITISNMQGLEIINASNCTNPALNIKIEETPILKELNLSKDNIYSFNVSSANDLKEVVKFNISECANLKGIKYGNEDIEEYEEYGIFYPILDISPMSKLSSEDLRINNTVFTHLKLNSNLQFVLTDEYFVDNIYLMRIFGKVRIEGSEVFAYCENFHLGKDIDEASEWQTTLEIGVENISDCFRNTSCVLEDAVYVLSLCDNVTIADNLFSSCLNIVTNDDTHQLPKDIFTHCGKITSMDGLFNGCLNMEGHLISATYDDNGNIIEGGIMSPLKSLVNFSGVFNSKMWIDDKFFYYINDNEKLKIKEIKNFNPSPLHPERQEDPSHLNPYYLLTALPEIEVIDKSFNGISMDFAGDASNCDLFYNNTKLTSISDSFNNMVYTSGYIYNLLGGNDDTIDMTDHYPQGLNKFVSSFSLAGDEPEKGYYKTPTYIEINGNFLRKIKSTLVYYGTMPENEYNTPTESVFFEMDKFCLYDDGFPSDIVKGCEKLITCTCMLNGLNIIDGFSSEYGEMNIHNVENDSPLPLPSEGMFNNCSKLTEIPYFFANLNGVKYSLAPFEFRNCSITNMSYIFADRHSMRRGMIPYGLFEVSGKGITQLNGALSESASSDLLCYECDWVFDDKYRRDDGTYKYLLEKDENGKYQWNKYVGDGVNTKIQEYYDNNKTMLSELGVDTLIEELTKNHIDPVHPRLSEKAYFGPFSEKGGDVSESFKGRLHTRNYFCSPDVFKYCKNEPSTNIDSMFNGCSQDKNPDFIEGIYGTICPYIFEPVSNILRLTNIFNGCSYLLPYKWDIEPLTSSGTFTFNGKFVSEDLLSKLNSLLSVAGLFSKNTIWGCTIIPSNLFEKQLALNDASSLFNSVNWVYITQKKNDGTEYETVPQLPDNIFANNGELQNVSAMFSNNYGKMYISENLLTTAHNKYINNCASFMSYSNEIFGSVPRLWCFQAFINGTMSYRRAFYEINENIENYSDIDQRMIDD